MQVSAVHCSTFSHDALDTHARNDFDTATCDRFLGSLANKDGYLMGYCSICPCCIAITLAPLPSSSLANCGGRPVSTGKVSKCMGITNFGFSSLQAYAASRGDMVKRSPIGSMTISGS